MKVALDANRRRVEKVFSLVEGALAGDEGIELESITSEEVERVVEVEKERGKGKGKETETLRKEEKEGKVDFSYVRKDSGSRFGESSKRKEAEADLD